MGTQSTKQYRDMTADEMQDWGQAEHAARILDLANRTPVGLKLAQLNAEARRKAIGASRNQAAAMVSDAGRARRRAEAKAQQNGG